MNRSCPDRATLKGWALVQPGEDPFRGRWWAIDVFSTRREARRCKGAGEKIVPVVVKRIKGATSKVDGGTCHG